MNSIVTVPYKATYSMPSMCCVCGSSPVPFTKAVTLRKGFNAGREITVLTQLPICIHCQQSTSVAIQSNVRAILAGFGGLVLAFVAIYLFGAVFRALDIGDAGTTVGMLLGLACMVAFPILFARPFIAKRDPAAAMLRKLYEQVKCHTMMASTYDADVVLEVPSSAFASAFAQQNGGARVEGSYILGMVVTAKS